jgi:hypothetical protein
MTDAYRRLLDRLGPLVSVAGLLFVLVQVVAQGLPESLF